MASVRAGLAEWEPQTCHPEVGVLHPPAVRDVIGVTYGTWSNDMLPAKVVVRTVNLPAYRRHTSVRADVWAYLLEHASPRDRSERRRTWKAIRKYQPTDTREPAHVSRSGNDALRCRCWRSSEAVSEQTLPRHRRASFWAQRSLSEHRVGSRRDASAGGGVTHVGFVVAAPGAVVRGNGPDEDGMASGSAVRPAVGLG